jgi:hypothetical protein
VRSHLFALLLVPLFGCAHFDAHKLATFDVADPALRAATYQGIPLKSGQVIVSDQGTPLSLFIAFVGQRFYPFVHAGVISIEDGEPFVYESLATIRPFLWGPPTDAASGRIRRTHFDAYVMRQRVVGIYDPPDDVDMVRVADFARRNYSRKTPFDPYFDFGDHEKLYCTEFVAMALQSGGLEGIEVTTVRKNASLRVALDWLKIQTPGIVFAGALTRTGKPVAVLSKTYSPAQVAAYFALKRELHRRFTDEQRLGNVFVWRGGRLGLRPEIRAFLEAGLSAAQRPRDASEQSIDALVASLADQMLGRFEGSNVEVSPQLALLRTDSRSAGPADAGRIVP